MNPDEKIDMFCHILPQRYKEALFGKAKPCYYIEADAGRPALFDLDLRFKMLDKFEGLQQVLTIGPPPLEYAFSPQDAVDLARKANDEMAELVAKYPERFVAGVACLPLNDIDASLRETDRAIKELNLKGIQMFSSVNGRPLDHPEFLGIYEKMAGYDLPIWLHPARDANVPDYPGEASSKYALFLSFGWPYETTLAMARLVFSGILEKYPALKCVSHHCGAMIPFFSRRVPLLAQIAHPGEVMKMTRPPLDYFRRFYADTVLGGNTPALMCGYDFFGADHMVFGTDYPYPGGSEQGEMVLGAVIKSVDGMNIGDEEKAKIFSKNAKRILNLS